MDGKELVPIITDAALADECSAMTGQVGPVVRHRVDARVCRIIEANRKSSIDLVRFPEPRQTLPNSRLRTEREDR